MFDWANFAFSGTPENSKNAKVLCMRASWLGGFGKRLLA
jgi:hypothetical protein